MEPIAIVGIGCRFPSADGPEAFWRLLAGGVDAITEVPSERWSLDELYDDDGSTPGKMNTRWGGFLSGVDEFDAGFFGISPREAAHVDPQQRLLMEVAWEAMEDAGLVPERLAGRPVGVFVGMSSYDYGSRQLASFDTIEDGYVNTGSALSIGANRLSYLFDFRGPSVVIDTACSSSLVSAYFACRSLASGESELALAGGVNLILSPAVTVGFSKLQAMAPDGRCKAFDARANGYVRSEGAGMVVLKRLANALEDGDRVYAVIRGGAVNQDGRTNGLTAPNGLSQEALVREALSSAGVRPSEVSYVEAHGTGTALGDPIELNALGAVLAPERGAEDRCAVGSVKSNLGHLEAAAGVAGLIKVALALEHREIPASLHYETPNPYIRFDVLPLRVPTALEALPEKGRPAIAGISSFGFGGTNAHLVLEEPPRPETAANEDADEPRLLPLSARNEGALHALTEAYARLLRESDGAFSFAEICATAATRRPHHDFRLAAVGASPAETASKLEEFLGGEPVSGLASGRRLTARRRKIAFIFPGQGSQWLGMGRELLEREPAFRESIERTAAAFAEHGDDWSLEAELEASEASSKLDRVDVIQPLIFAVQVALAALWREWGVKPDAVVGHSMGEVAAAHVAGALGIDDAARIICLRSRLAKRTSGRGSMAVVDLGLDAAREALTGLEDRLAVAVSNSPTSSVLSGDTDALENVLVTLERADVFCRRVKVDYASHSPQMDSLTEELLAILSGVAPRRARVPLYSTVTAAVATGAELDAAYWVRNLREPVLFSAAIEKLLQDKFDVFVEVSPHPVLLPAIQQCLHHWEREGTALGSLRRDEPERAALLDTLGSLYALGRPVDWSKIYAPPPVPARLPRYPWQRERHWLDGGMGGPPARVRKSKNPLVGEHVVSATSHGMHLWQRELGTATLPFLADHRVEDDVVVPAAAYLEMALEAGREALGDDVSFAVANTRFGRPLLLSEQDVTVQVTLERSGAGPHVFQIFSRGMPDAAWTLHARGELRAVDEGTGERAAPGALSDLRERCPDEVGAEEHYRRMEARGLHYGDAFRTVERVFRGRGEAVAELRAPGVEAARYQMPPALVDGALQSLAHALPSEATAPDVTYVPTEVELLSTFGALPASEKLWAHAVAATGDGDAFHGNVRVLTEGGIPLAEIRGVRLEPLAPSADEGFYEIQWEASRRDDATESSRRVWLVVGGPSELATDVASRLEVDGATVHSCESTVDFDRVFEQVRPEGVVHLTSLDPTSTAPGWQSALLLTQSLVRRTWEGRPRLWLVTRGAQPAREGDEVDPEQAPLWGLARTIAQEHPELGCTAVDVDPLGGNDEGAALAEELVHASNEQQVALRGDERLAARISKAELAPPASPVADGGLGWALRAEVGEPGNLDSIHWRVGPRAKPGPNDVVVEARAAGLNFRDVFLGLGILPSEPDGASPIGLECAGRVVALGASVEGVELGDEVLALGPGSLSTLVRTHAALVAPKPARLTLEEAASLPVALLTAHYALHHMAHLRGGERVLIHSATGGVGLACLRFAEAAGAEIFATAGTEEKRRLLDELGVARAMSSRSLDFADEVLEATGGEGVDVVVNSLAGDAVSRGVSLLRPGGRFIELGKRDLLEGGKIPLDWLANNRAFILVDLNRLAAERPTLAGELLREALHRFEELDLPPSRCEVFPASELADAFRHFARAEHIGKIVISMEEAPAQIAPPTDAAARIRDDHAYLVTGGLGGIGLVTARWLVGEGARHLVLWGRRAPSAEAREQIDSMERAGARVLTERVDVSDRGQVEAAMERARRRHPVAGIFHAAGVLDDGILLQQTPERFRNVMAPKIDGAVHLHEVSLSDPIELFVLFSSAASVLGSAGQAGYAAANQFLDALAHLRRRKGLPAVSINWGPWSEVGLAARPDRGGRLATQGLRSISPRAGMAALERILLSDASQVSVLLADWRTWLAASPALASAPHFARVAGEAEERDETNGLRGSILSLPAEERAEALAERLRSLVASVLRLAPAKIDLEQPLVTMGIDSLMAVELKNRIERAAGATLPLLQLIKGPSLSDLADKLLEQMTGETSGAAGADAGPEAASGKSLLLSLLSLKDEKDAGSG